MRLIEREYTPNPMDGTSTWQGLPSEVDTELDGKFATNECEVVIGGMAYGVRLTSDDADLVDMTVRYHETNNRFLPAATYRSPNTLSVFYSTQQDIEVEDTALAMGNNPYVAAMTSDGSRVIATGKPSVGTAKSIIFGAVSTLACRGTDFVPLHASVGTFDREGAFGVSGRGNWGKTTNMIGAKLVAAEITVVTDDWSIVSSETGGIVPVDMLVAIRPEAIGGILAAAQPNVHPSYFESARKDSGTLLSVEDIFGEAADPNSLTLRRLLLTDKRPEFKANPRVYGTDGLDVAWRLQDDAYHSYDIDDEYQIKYKNLAEIIEVSTISTTLYSELRSLQLAHIVRFFRGQ